MPERARKALIGAGVLTVLLFLTWLAAFHVGFVERADQWAVRGFRELGFRPRVNRIAVFVANLCDPKPYVYFCVVPVLVALARRRVRVAVAVAAILIGANVTTELLKPILAHPRPSNLIADLPGTGPIGSASWPSGHATAAMSLALASVLAASGRLRPYVAAAGAVFAVAVSYSFLSLAWHYPTDVVGGFLVAGIWTLLAVAAVTIADARAPASRTGALAQRLTIREALGPPSAALLAAFALAVVVAVARPAEVASYARVHTAFVLGAIAVGAAGLAVATGVMLALRK
jgi:membrane-associated phospholipid phosphatase